MERMSLSAMPGNDMDDTQKQILQRLSVMEAERGIKIPLAVESGSRAWGFASPDSDYDCRFVYVKPKVSYLSVFEEKDTIEFTPDAVFDLGGWDVKKAVALLVKSNAVILEWLSSGVVYRKDERVWRVLWRVGQAFFNPVAVSWHYLSMARNKLAEIEQAANAKIKKYFYVMRPLACIGFIEAHGSIPHMEYRKNLAEIDVSAAIRDRIELLMRQKETALEGDMIPQDKILVDFFRTECASVENRLSALHHEKNRNYEQADKAFREILEMVRPNE